MKSAPDWDSNYQVVQFTIKYTIVVFCIQNMFIIKFQSSSQCFLLGLENSLLLLLQMKDISIALVHKISLPSSKVPIKVCNIFCFYLVLKTKNTNAFAVKIQ